MIGLMVTTKMSEKHLQNCYHEYKFFAINTQVKDHIPLKKQKNVVTVDLSRFEKVLK